MLPFFLQLFKNGLPVPINKSRHKIRRLKHYIASPVRKENKNAKLKKQIQNCVSFAD